MAPEDKVHLVDILRKKGHIVAMTGDGVNDAPALKQADIGVAMGITGTEVSKEAANMILTDDNFATIVNAVELGRGLYDNLKKYIRFQIGVLIGYIALFLGSRLLNVLGGVPFVPLQTLFMNFTIQIFQAVGLGYGQPAGGLMKRRPRPSNEPLLSRTLLVWLSIAGVVMGGGTLATIAWAANAYDDTVARTMGMVVFSLSNVAFSLATKDEQLSAFSLDLLGDRPFFLATLASIVTIVLMAQLDFLNRFLDTTGLSGEQWAHLHPGGPAHHPGERGAQADLGRGGRGRHRRAGGHGDRRRVRAMAIPAIPWRRTSPPPSKRSGALSGTCSAPWTALPASDPFARATGRRRITRPT